MWRSARLTRRASCAETRWMVAGGARQRPDGSRGEAEKLFFQIERIALVGLRFEQNRVGKRGARGGQHGGGEPEGG